MTGRSLIGTIIVFHLFSLPLVIIAIGQVRLRPGWVLSYVALIPALLLLGCAYTDCLGELLRRRGIKKGASNKQLERAR